MGKTRATLTNGTTNNEVIVRTHTGRLLLVKNDFLLFQFPAYCSDS